MRYLLILLSFWALSATAQDMGKPTQVIEVWDNTTAPHSNELTEPTIIQNSRPRFTTETRIYLYTPAKGKHNGRGVVICPGGGYQHLSMENEGARMAEWFAAHGYVAAVLHYRMPNGHPEVPLEDACQAIRLLRGKVEGILPEWQVQRVGIVGSSAGGHLAAMTSTMGEERPDFTLLFYPVIAAGAQRQHKGSFDRLLGEQRTPEQSDYYSLQNRVTNETPPAFILYADDDRTVPSVNGPIYYIALKEHGVRASLHIYPYGGHGFGMKDSFHYKPSWMPLMLDWIDTILKK
jgi:acetyl esterase/lipase